MPTVYALTSDSKPTWLNASGDPASGYQLFVYEAGTSTKTTTYRDSDGAVANANPIVLDSRGEPGYGIYVVTGTYKLVLAPDTDTDPPASAVWTRDDITPINDVANATADEWTASGLTPTYVSGTQFTLVGDQTTEFHEGRRLRITDSGGTDYGVISASAYTSLTTVTVVLDSGSIDSGISAVDYGILSADNSAAPHMKSDSDGVSLTGNLRLETGSLRQQQGSDVASASTLPINVDGNFFDVTGTTAITALASKGVGTQVVLQFDGALTLTHHATDLILPNSLDITTTAGDIGVFYEYASADWRCVSYRPANQVTVQTPVNTGYVDLTTGSPSSVAFTGIPSWAQGVLLLVDQASLDGAEDFLLQLGDSSSIEATGYVGSYATAGATVGSPTDAFYPVSASADGSVVSGVFQMYLADSSTNAWVASWSFARQSGSAVYDGAGAKAVTGAVTRIQIKSSGGALFDAGNAALLYW